MSLSLFRRSPTCYSGLKASLFHVTSLRLAGGGPSPGWSIPDDKSYHKHTYQPTIPDKHYFTAHYNYAPFTLWLRARKPAMEKVGKDIYYTVYSLYNSSMGKIISSYNETFPGFSSKLMGFVGVLLGYNLFFCNGILEESDAYMTLEKLRLYSVGKSLADEGFYATESEDQEKRIQDYNTKSLELESLWQNKLAEASQKRDFSVLTDSLSVSAIEKDHHLLPLVGSISWRLNNMPYGRNSFEAKTFPKHDTIDSPSGSNMFWGDFLGNAGEYIEREDNKVGMLKKARHHYTTVYIPPTK